MINGEGGIEWLWPKKNIKYFLTWSPSKPVPAELKLHSKVLVKEQKTFHTEIFSTKDARPALGGNRL